MDGDFGGVETAGAPGTTRAWSRDDLARALPAYEIGEELGCGAHAVVVAARHRRLDREVAVKQLLTGFGGDTEIGARFVTEAKLLASLDHPHVLPIYDFVEVDGLCLLVMERLSGGTVRTRMTGEGFSAQAACAVILATCAALEHAHSKGVLHRDIKPQNLLLSADGVLKVADFGIARLLDASSGSPTRTGAVLGTPAYMAPEQIRGDAPSARIDVYATGTVLYELLCGRRPFPPLADPIAELYQHAHEQPVPLLSRDAQLPVALGEVTDRALRTDPAERFATAGELAAALARAAEAEWGAGWTRPTGVLVRAGVELPISQGALYGATQATGPERPSLLDRGGELAAIHARIDAAATGSGGVIVIEGAPGIGKSELLAAARTHACQAGLAVLSASGDELEQNLPCGVIRQLLEPRLRGAQPAEREDLFSGAAALAAPVFVGALGDAADADAVSHGVYWLLANLAQRRPLVLIIDDAHWCDVPSLRALVYLARRIDGMAITVVAAIRPDGRGSAQDLLDRLVETEQTEVVRPGPLSQSAVEALVRQAVDEPADDAFCRECREATGGNPFFLRELLMSLEDLELHPGRAAASRVAKLGPKSVGRVLARRLAGLAPEAGMLARALAVLGDGAPLRRVAALAGIDPVAAGDHADGLAAAEIFGAGRPLAFVNPIVRTAVYEGLSPARRSDAHAAAARLLQAEGRPATELAGHALLCDATGDPWIVDTLVEAAAAASAVGALESTVVYLERALNEPPSPALLPALLLELGRAEARLLRPGATERLRRALEAEKEPVRRAHVARELAVALTQRAEPTEGVAVVEAALAELGDAEQETALALEVALLDMAQLDWRLRSLLLQRLGSLRDRVEPGAAPPFMLAILARESSIACEPAAATVDLAERALEGISLVADGSGHRGGLYAPAVLFIADRFESARHHAARLLEGSRARGDVWGFSIASYFLGCCAYRQGALSEAEADLRQALAAFGGSPILFPYATAVLIEVLLDRGELRQATELLEAAQLPDELPDPTPFTLLLEARGRLRLATHEPEAAAADFHATGERRAREGIVNPAWSPWRSGAALANLALDRAEAQRLAREELELALRFGAPRAVGIALRVCGIVEGGDEGLYLLREAVGVLAGSDARLEHARALVELGAGTRRAGLRSESREALRAGVELADRCGARPLAERARRELVESGARPRRSVPSKVDALSPEERRVAEIAASGATNPEIAQALFVTVKEVEGHLRSVYGKLQIAGRHELATAVTPTRDEAQPTPSATGSAAIAAVVAREPRAIARRAERAGLVERDAERQALRDVVRAAHDGVGAAAVIQGPAGIGKTSLLREVTGLAEAAGAVVLRAGGREMERDYAFGAIRQLLAGQARRLARTPGALQGAARLAGPLLGVKGSPGEHGEESERELAFCHGLYWLVCDLAERGPLVLVVDDLHEVDPPSLRFLLYLVQRLEGLPVAFVGALRTNCTPTDADTLAQITVQPVVRALDVAGLNAGGLAELVRRALGDEPSSEFVAACAEVTGGNPFLAVQLLGEAADEGLLPDADAAARIRELVPDAVAGAVLTRLGREPGDVRALARAVAILGDDVQPTHAASLAALDPAAAARCAERLVELALLRPGRPLGFRHPLLRATVLAGTPAGERSLAHARAAQLLQADGAPAAAVAAHLIELDPAGDQGVVAVLRVAAAAALAEGAADIAVRHLRRALVEPPTTSDRGALLADLGYAASLAGDAATAADALDESVTLATDPADHLSRRLRAFGAHFQLDGRLDRDDIVEIIDRVDAVGDTLDPATLALAGDVVGAGTNLPDLLPELGARLARYQTAPGDTVTERMMLATLARVACLTEPAGRAASYAHRALAGGSAEENSETVSTFIALFTLIDAEQLDVVDEHLYAMIAAARRRGSLLGYASASGYLAVTAYQRGDVARAQIEAEVALETGRLHAALIPIVLACLVRARLAVGDVDGAAAAIAPLGDADVPDLVVFNHVLVARAQVRYAVGDLDGALAGMRQALQRLPRAVRYTRVLPWRQFAVPVLLAAGLEDEAAAVAADDVAAAQDWGTPAATGAARATLALCLPAHQRPAVLGRAITELERSAGRLDLASARLLLGETLTEVGDHDAARAPLLAGVELAESCGARALIERGQQALAATGAQAPQAAVRRADELTPSERRVAGLAAEGLSDRAIAEALFVTVKAVEDQLERVYSKLRIGGRDALGALLTETVGAHPA